VNNTLKTFILDKCKTLRSWFLEDRRRMAMTFGCIIVLLIYGLSKGDERVAHIFHDGDSSNFESIGILGNPYKDIFNSKVDLLEETKKRIKEDNDRVRYEMASLREEIRELAFKREKFDKKPDNRTENKDIQDKKRKESSTDAVSFSKSPLQMDAGSGIKNSTKTVSLVKKTRKRKKRLSKSQVIFPVKVKTDKLVPGVVLGVGSWVLGTIIAGAEIPQSKTYPVLIQLDQAYTMANKKSLSLAGCLMIAKASTVMSTRHVELQPESMGCFSKSGKYFEKKNINGWGTDSLDNNFGIKAEFKSNIGRVAEFAFVKSMLEGAQEIISRKSKQIGGGNPDRPDMLVQQGAVSSASMMANFLMRQARNLLPTLSVNSGRQVYIVMKDSIRLPYEFFSENEGVSNAEYDLSFNVLD